MAPFLTQEIEQRVLGYVAAREDTKALRACALAHRSFVARCQAALFYRVTIRKIREIDALARLSPRILAYIRDLRIAPSSDWLSTYTRHSYFEDNMDALTGLLVKLPAVLHLHIDSSLTSELIDYADLSVELRRAILEKLPSLRTLALTDVMRVPLALLDHLQDVQELHLENALFEDKRGVELIQRPTGVKPPARLSRLTYTLHPDMTRPSGFADFVKKLGVQPGAGTLPNAPLDISALRSLRLQVKDFRQEQRSILDACKDTLN
ncbi:hypothetical protein BD626DRAFT_192111 [Schizophyllum amplum]|uniref:F-box domain-containing protein n=1 Tax=Schizophyllum amplum TaxID=97359 RepID=A0A550CM00_9AGAR|nr:hypothetical protein BD626DRAFT_192111 [Auriculariopsis ampla]